MRGEAAGGFRSKIDKRTFTSAFPATLPQFSNEYAFKFFQNTLAHKHGGGKGSYLDRNSITHQMEYLCGQHDKKSISHFNKTAY